jgi:hypothetical protein
MLRSGGASARAMPSPMPLVEPVTRATLSDRFTMIVLSMKVASGAVPATRAVVVVVGLMRTAYGRAYRELSAKRWHSVWIDARFSRPNPDGSLATWPHPGPSMAA